MKDLVAALGRSRVVDARVAAREAVQEALSKLGGQRVALALLTSTVDHDAAAVFEAVRGELHEAPISGVTTSLGVLGVDGVSAGNDGVVGVLLFGENPGRRYEVGFAELGNDPRAAGRAAASQVASRGEGQPRVLLVMASPGSEEDVLTGIVEVFPNTPVYGGSAADNTISGEWSVFTNEGPRSSAVSVVGLFGDVKIGGAFLSPYAPTTHSAVVTSGHERVIEALDGEPAANVLARWLGSSIDFQLKEGGNILAQTALSPLAIRRETARGDHFVTLHPASIEQPSGSVSVFARAAVGQTVCLMAGTRHGLIEILPKLLDEALESGELAADEVRAGLLIYCAGCAGAIGQELDRGLRQHLGSRLAGVPLIGMCTFGEQGHVPGLGSVHQDLSVGLVLIG